MEKLKQQAETLGALLQKNEHVGAELEAGMSSLQSRLSTLGTGFQPVQEAMTCHENVSDTLSEVQEIVDHLNHIDEAEKVISKGPSEDLHGFLEAMHQLEKSSLFFKSIQNYKAGESTLLRVNGLLSEATQMAETEFNRKLTALSLLVDPTSLINEPGTSTEQEIVVYKVPTLISPEQIPLLHDLVDKLVLGGHQTQCINIYKDARVDALQQNLNHLGLEKIHRMSLETRIPEWIKLMRISVKSLFVGERNLCNQVLEGIEISSLDQCLLEVTSSNLARLLCSGEDVVNIQKSPEKLIILLDMYEMMCELEQEMEALFASKASIALQPMVCLKKWLATTATDIFLRFCELAVKDASEPMANEDVHPICSFVMEHLNIFLDYQDILTQLLEGQERDLQFAQSFMQVLQALQSNLEEKSKYWTDHGQSYLFMMNNIHYMVTSVQKTKGAKELLGEDWIQKQRRVVQVNANQYKKAAWEKVVDAISSQGLVSLSEGSPSEGSIDLTITAKKITAKKSVFIKRLTNFNKQFEEQYKKQCLWKVYDPELREYLRLSVAEIIVSAYRSFMQLLGPMLEKSKSKCVKYTPEEIERMLLEELFAERETPG